MGTAAQLSDVQYCYMSRLLDC